MQSIIKKIYFINRNTEKFKILVNSLCLLFLRDIHEAYLPLKDAHDKQSKFANTLKSIDQTKKSYF